MQTAARFNHETVLLDGEDFVDCAFQTCKMVYAGGDLPTFNDCRFDDCDWKFDDAAARTLAQLKQVWNAGGKSSVQAMIKEITGVAR